MSRATSSGPSGSSTWGWLRLFGLATGLLLGGGASAAIGTLQVLTAPDPPLRLVLLLASSARGSLLGMGAALLAPFRGWLVAGGVLLIGLVLVSRVAAARAAARATAAAARGSAAAERPAPRSGAPGREAPARSAPRSAPWSGVSRPASGSAPGAAPAVPDRPVVVVSAVTGRVGRARLGGRAWTVRGTTRLQEGHQYVVVARNGDVLEVTG